MYEFMQDPEWKTLDSNMRRKVIALSFSDEIASDPEWNYLPEEKRGKIADLYLRDAYEADADQFGAIDGFRMAIVRGLDVAGESLGGAMKMVGIPGGEYVRSLYEERAERPELQGPLYLQEKTVVEEPERLVDPKWWVNIIGENLPNMAMMMAPGAAAYRGAKALGYGTKTAETAGLLGGAAGAFTIEAGSAYNQAKEEMAQLGYSDEESEPIATTEGAIVGTINSLLEITPFSILLKNPGGKKFLGRIIRQGLWEGGTEGVQETVNVLAERLGHGSDIGLKDTLGRVVESGLAGAVLGGGVGIYEGGAQSQIKRPIIPDVTTDILQADSVDEAIARSQDAIQNVLSRTVKIQKPYTAEEAARSFFGDRIIDNELARLKTGLPELTGKSAEESAAVFETARKEQIVKDYGRIRGATRQIPFEETREGFLTRSRQKNQELINQIETEANKAATSPQNERPEPTEAQKEAGNYRKGHITLSGMEIAIENPRGSERTGIDKSGNRWSTKMENHYGYFNRTEGKDGDQIDAFIGPDIGSRKAFIVDQVDPETGKFDEHKTLLGFRDIESAREGYLQNYEEGWQGLGEITEVPIDEFKAWIGDGTRKSSPFSSSFEEEKQEIVRRETMEEENATRLREHERSVLPGEAGKGEEALQREGAGEGEEAPVQELPSEGRENLQFQEPEQPSREGKLAPGDAVNYETKKGVLSGVLVQKRGKNAWEIERPDGTKTFMPEGKISKGESPDTITEKINTDFPGNDLRFEGIQQPLEEGGKPTYQWTPQEGPAKGATFSTEYADVETVRSELEKKVEQFAEKPAASTKQEFFPEAIQHLEFKKSKASQYLSTTELDGKFWDWYNAVGKKGAENAGIKVDKTSNGVWYARTTKKAVDLEKPSAAPETAKVAPEGVAGDWKTGTERPFVFDPNSTKNEGRFRLQPPEEFNRTWTAKPDGKTPPSEYGLPEVEGIQYIVGYQKGKKGVHVQAIRFKKDMFSEQEAADWWDKNADKFSFSQKLKEPTEQFSIKPGEGNLSVQDVQDIFKNQAVGLSPEGSIWVKTKGGQTLTINRVDQISDKTGAFQIAYGREFDPDNDKFSGKYSEGEIQIQKDIGDKWSVAHESVHFMEDVGLLTNKEIEILKAHIRGRNQKGTFKTLNKDDIGGAEDRAQFISDQLRERSAKGPIGRIIQKIADFVDSLVNLFHRTARGVVRGIESGKAYERKGRPATRTTEYQKLADKWYSKMEQQIDSPKFPNKGTVQTFTNLLNSMANKGQIKAEELEWSGALDWLKIQEGKVSKEELLNYLAENNVKTEEVEKAEQPSDADLEDEALSDAYNLLRDRIVRRGIDLDENLETLIDEWMDEGGSAEKADEIEDITGIDPDLVYNDAINSLREERRGTKFHDYQLPGGENYRELLLTLPINKLASEIMPSGEERVRVSDTKRFINQPTYRSSHWDEPNVLAHIRFNERTDANGNRVLFIEEIQSDWAQAGRKKGFKGTVKKEDLEARWHEPKIPEGHDPKVYNGYWEIYNKNTGELIIRNPGNENKNQKQEAVDEAFKTWVPVYQQGRLPNMPFKKTWPLLTIKRMIRYAAENGYDTIAWTPGEVQAERYDLSKRVGTIETQKMSGNKYLLAAYSHAGDTLIEEQEIEAEKLTDYVGKDVADKILLFHEEHPNTGTRRPHGMFSGEDLKIGGEGMKGFYDKILPAEVNKFFNKAMWGKAKVETIEIQIQDESDYSVEKVGDIYRIRQGGVLLRGNGFKTAEDAWSRVDEAIEKSEVWSLPITPEMRQKALYEGMPQFQVKQENPTIRRIFKQETTLKDNLSEYFEASKEKENRELARDKVIANTLDKLHFIKQRLGDRAYKVHRALTGIKSASFAMFLEHGKLDWKGDVLTATTKGKGILPFFRSIGPDWKNLLYYTAAKRSEQLAREGRENWITDDDRKEIAKIVGAKIIDGKIVGGKSEKGVPWDVLNKRLQEFNKNILDVAEASGLIDPESRASWEQDYYIPFYRIFENEATKQEYLAGPKKTKQHITSQIRRLKGGKAQIGDPVENLFKNWMYLLDAAARNKARGIAFDIGEDIGIIEQVPKQDLVNVLGSKKEVRWAIKNPGATRATKILGTENEAKEWASANMKEYEIERREETSVKFGNMKDLGVLSFQRDGKPIYFKTDDVDLYNSLLELNPDIFNNAFMKLMGKAKRTLSYTATFGAAFKLRNMLRDTLHVAIISKDFKPFIDSARGVMKSMREDQDYIEYMASGFGFGSSYVDSADPEAAAKFLQRVIKTEGRDGASRILDTPRKVLNIWEKIGSASENAARVALYQNLKEKGYSNLDAGFEARDLMDFSMSGGGTTTQLLIRTIPFLNARVQAFYKLGRAAKQDPKSFAIRSGMLTFASLALWSIFKDDDRYKELEDWDKWTYYHFWVGDLHYRIPKPFEIGAFFSSMPETMANVINGTEEGKEMWDWFKFTANDMFRVDMPQLFKPLVEERFNRSMFTGRPIVPEYMQNLKASEQYHPWTSETARLIGGAINMSPLKVQHFVRGYLATIGTGVLSGMDVLMQDILGVYPYPKGPSRLIDDYGLGFIKRSAPASSVKYMSDFYELYNEMDGLNRTLNHYRNTGQHKKADALQEDERKRKLLLAKPKYNKINTQIRKINNRIKMVYRSSMTPAKKRETIDSLTDRRNKLLSGVGSV